MKNRFIFLLSMCLLVVIAPASSVFADEDVFIPIVIDNQSAATMASHNTWPDGSIKVASAPDVDLFNLPTCTKEMLTNMIRVRAPMDPNSQGGCLLDSEPIPLNDIESMSVGEVSAADVYMTRKYSLNQFNCSTCSSTQGIIGAYGLYSANPVTLDAGYSWTNKWYGNYMTVGDTQLITCQNGSTQLQRAIAGVGQGVLTANMATMTSPEIYYELIRNGSCYGYRPSLPVGSQYAASIEIYKDADGVSSSFWTGRTYYGSGFVYLFSHIEFSFVKVARLFSTGQEIGAYDGVHSAVNSPINFAHKLAVTPYGGSGYITFHQDWLPSYFGGKIQLISSSPLNSLGHTANADWTSRSSNAP